MMKLHLLCLLAALPLIASDDQSKQVKCACTNCHNNTCTPSTDETCVAVAAETNLGNFNVSGTYRTCMKKDLCKEGNVAIMTETGVFWRSNTKCCRDDKCNDVALTVQAPETTKGNQKCPTCFAENASSCKIINMTCAPSETHCLTIHGYITPVQESTTSKTSGAKDQSTPESKTPFYMRGCGTEEGILGSDVQLILPKDVFQFTSHGNPSQVSGSIALTVLLPSLIGLLLDKFLY